MAKMFKKFNETPDTYKPNNICIPKKCSILKDIIVGTTPEHILSLPFDISKEVKKMAITYKQGIRTVVTRTHLSVNIFSEDPHIIYYKLTEQETKEFKAIPNTPIKVQIKILLNTGSIVASDIYTIQCLPALDDIILNDVSEARTGDIQAVDMETGELLYAIPQVIWGTANSTEVRDVETGEVLFSVVDFDDDSDNIEAFEK